MQPDHFKLTAPLNLTTSRPSPLRRLHLTTVSSLLSPAKNLISPSVTLSRLRPFSLAHTRITMAATFSPAPYQEGKLLNLQVCESYSRDLPSRVTATISKVVSMTMSVVLDVTFQTRHGPPIHRVLKLYDRRFGSCLRDVLEERRHKPVPHTQENEAAFEAFVRRGMMPGFLRYLKERNETEIFAVPPWEFLDEPNRTEGLAKYEATLWQDCIEHFECETKAYKRLADLQGKLVPRMLAHVSLSATNLATMPQQAASYFEVKGILLERIDGYCLEDLTLAPHQVA
ncbi:hypothetical protein VTK56DRAFT_4994 [Thermocarpiscus australiensis]